MFDDTPDELRPTHYILVNGKIKAVDCAEWGVWFGNFENRMIDRTELDNDVSVSTVFIGIDMSLFRDVPLLFETMIFGGEFDSCGWRYAGYEEAKRGHWHIVDQLRSGQKPSLDFDEV